MRHLTRADYLGMPWANGRGTTIELLREDCEVGLLWRLSMASVTEDGPFSIFPDIDRVLVVVDGPGFELIGEQADLLAEPLKPVTFPGDVPIAAAGVQEPSVDFNLMWRRGRVAVDAVVIRDAALPRLRGIVALFALEAQQVRIDMSQRQVARDDLLVWADTAPNIRIGGLGLAIGIDVL